MNIHRQVAQALIHARRTGVGVRPPRESFADMSLDDAYAIQFAQERIVTARGEKVVGRKIGLTSLAMQQQMGVDQPDFGFVTDSMRFDDEHHFHPGDFIAPKVEPELALVLGEDLTGPGCTLQQAIAAVTSAHAAIEIIDSRVANWDIKLVDTIADNASCGAIAVNAQPMSVAATDLDRVSCSLLIDGQPVAAGVGREVMGHPAAPLAWLANTLGERGIRLTRGQVVLTGSFTASHPVESGHGTTADFGEFGSITVSF